MEKGRPETGRAVVSGLGPNGVAAALELLKKGYRVTVVEKRSKYTRPIHLHLRSTYLRDIRRLSEELYERLMAIATPIEENSRTGSQATDPVPNYLQDRRATPREGEPCPVWSRLSTPPERHVRLDNAERLFYEFLQEKAAEPDSRLTIRRGPVLQLQPTPHGYYRVLLQGESDDLGVPALVVIAEGGKSVTVRDLGLESVRFSYPKYFMSAHVTVPFGPRTRRIDTDVRELVDDPGVTPAEVSLWASGHGDSNEGTWVVLEVPEALLHQHPDQAEEYFLKGALLLMGAPVGTAAEALRAKIKETLHKGALLSRKRGANLPGMEAASKKTFAGTFKFEQQCLRFPAAGKNVVVLGDAAGMGHHALSSGLEMGAYDLVALGVLCEELQQASEPEECIARYAEAVRYSRLRLLGLGMNEYYPDSAAGRLRMLHRAAELFGEGEN